MCRFQCSTARATSIPPMNRMLVSLRYSVLTWQVGTVEKEEGVPPCLWAYRVPILIFPQTEVGPLGSWTQMEMVFGSSAI